MRVWLLFIALIVAGPVSGQAKPNGGYTEAQAARGATVYTQYCVACHGASLQGESGPALTGQVLRAAYGGGSAAQLYDFISRQMPQNAPASLKQWQYLDVTAYVLSRNGLAAGSTSLAVETLLVLSLLMPIATTVVWYHSSLRRRRLIAMLLVGALSTTFALTRVLNHRDPIVSYLTRERVRLRTAAARKGAHRALQNAVEVAWRDLVKVRGVDGDEFGIRTTVSEIGEEEHGVARLERLDLGADGGDDTGGVPAERRRRLDSEQRGNRAGADLPVDRVDAGGDDAHEHLARAGDGHGNVLQRELVGGAEGVEADGFHGDLLESCLGVSE